MLILKLARYSNQIYFSLSSMNSSRPKCVDEVAFQDEVVAVLKKSLEGADVSNSWLLFFFSFFYNIGCITAFSLITMKMPYTLVFGPFNLLIHNLEPFKIIMWRVVLGGSGP